MKTSNDSRDAFDLERDLPTTLEDVAALKRLRGVPGLDGKGYVRFLASFEPPSSAELRSRKGPRGEEPFSLA
jgi:hypothetical protein